MATSTLHGIESYYHNRDLNYIYWSEGNVFTTLDPRAARNIFTTVFVLLNFFFAPVGAFYLKSRNLDRLRTKIKGVAMNRLTSWLSYTGTLNYFWHTKQLPGGFYGYLMLLTGLFGILHQYFINSYILPVNMQSKCIFESGVVTTAGDNYTPSTTFRVVSTVYNAQYQAIVVNHGLRGIYEKVNFDDHITFSPIPEDVIGGWNCSYFANTTIEGTNWQSETNLQSFLVNQQDFELFPNASAIGLEYDRTSSALLGFLAWSADQPNESGQQWKLRASISNNLTGLAGPVDSTAIVTNLECELVAKANWTLPLMPSNESLNTWSEKAYGFLMSAEPDDFGFLMEWILNGMVMESGSGNSDRKRLPMGASPFYGCMVLGTEIMYQIWIILALILVVFVPMLFRDIFLFSFRYLQRSNNDTALAEAASVPVSVHEWQVALLREVTEDPTIQAKDMRDFSYWWDDSKKKFAPSRGYTGFYDAWAL